MARAPNLVDSEQAPYNFPWCVSKNDLYIAPDDNLGRHCRAGLCIPSYHTSLDHVPFPIKLKLAVQTVSAVFGNLETCLDYVRAVVS